MKYNVNKVVVGSKIIVQNASTVKITELGVSELITSRDFNKVVVESKIIVQHASTVK